MKKVLILTASFGEGHNTAARNVRDALELASEDVAVEVLDLFASTYGIINFLHAARRRRLKQIAQHAIVTGMSPSCHCRADDIRLDKAPETNL